MDKRFAIFDMDGTLADSMVYWKNLAKEFLESKGVRTISPDILERIKPMTMTESAALFIQEYGLPGTAERVAAEMNAMMDEHYRQDIPLGKPLAQQKQEENHKEADGNQQAQIEYPIIRLHVLSFRQNNILHEQDTVNDGTGCYAEKLKQEQGDDKGNCQYAQNLSG